jgi:hypothetical protein
MCIAILGLIMFRFYFIIFLVALPIDVLQENVWHKNCDYETKEQNCHNI